MSVRSLTSAGLVLGLLLGIGGPVAAQDKEHAAIKPVPKEGNWTKRHEGFLAEAKKGGIDIVFIGDSITDEWRRAPEDKYPRGGVNVWKKTFEPMKAANFGIGGDRTQHVLWRIKNGTLDGIQPKVVVLLIGTNNSNGKDHTPEEIADGIKAIVTEVKAKQPMAKVLLLGILPRGKDPSADPIKAQREKIKQVNTIISKLDDGGKTVKYLDIGEKFLEKDGTISPEMMVDYLHLNEKAYQIFADAIKGPLAELAGKS